MNGTTYAIYGYASNVTGAPDNRQIFEAAAQACSANNGTLVNLTNANTPFLSYLFTAYRKGVNGGAGWGNRKICAWVGLTNMTIYNMPSFSTISSYTPELFWAEDAGAACGAVGT